jgi:hypothetical protein
MKPSITIQAISWKGQSITEPMTRRGAADLLRACRRERGMWRVTRRENTLQIAPRYAGGMLIDLFKE